MLLVDGKRRGKRVLSNATFLSVPQNTEKDTNFFNKLLETNSPSCEWSGAADPSHGEEGSGLLSIPDLCQWQVEWLTHA